MDSYTTLVGIRFRIGASFFWQVLAGQHAFRIKADTLPALEQTVVRTAIQPGAGYDFRVADNVLARVMVDYRIVNDDFQVTSQLRVATGVVFGIGRR